MPPIDRREPRTAGTCAAPSSTYLVFHEAVSLFWWGWAILSLIVAAPMAGYLWHVCRGDEVIAGSHTWQPASSLANGPLAIWCEQAQNQR
jgi:hypothetical protein